MFDYDFDLDGVLRWLRQNGSKRVLIEAPDGLKGAVIERVFPKLRENGYTVFLSSKPYHGACEVGDEEGRALGVDHVVHFGHNQMVARALPTLYVPAYSRFDPSPSFPQLDALLGDTGKRIGIAASVQYLPSLDAIEAHLRERSYEVIRGKGNRAAERAQILGCDYIALTSLRGQVDLFLLVASGDFHPLGALLALERPILQLDPYSMSWHRLDVGSVKPWLVKEGYAWLKLLDAKRVGVVVGTEPGQKFLWEAEAAAKAIRAMGKEVALISASFLDAAGLSALPFDVLVLAACPRLPYDDSEAFGRPVVSVFSVLRGGPGGLTSWLRGEKFESAVPLGELEKRGAVKGIEEQGAVGNPISESNPSDARNRLKCPFQGVEPLGFVGQRTPDVFPHVPYPYG